MRSSENTLQAQTHIQVEIKLSAARTKLIIDKPFLGALVLRLPMLQADPCWCKTTATDAQSFYFNTDFIDSLSLDETQFILAHEALHCALSHFARRQHRLKHRWDLACDYAINPMLINDGLKAPPGSLYLREYEGMTAEEIYPLLDEQDQSETLDEHIYDEQTTEGGSPDNADSDQTRETPPEQQQQNECDGNSEKKQDNRPQSKRGNKQGQDQSQQNDDQQQSESEPEQNTGAAQPPPLTHDEREALNVQWKQRLAGAAQSAMQAGKLGDEMARLVDFFLQPELPWRNLLTQYMTNVARDDYSYTRPSTRRGDPAIFPSLRSAQIDIVIVLDTSGSISDAEIRGFISEIDAIKSMMRARITLHACDAILNPHGPWIFEAWEAFNVPENIYGGGGTSFVPVFEWAQQMDQLPDLLVYFTDAEGEFPEEVPEFPVIWLVKGKHKNPWGQRVQLN